jgi:4-hydroxybenzoate polyprenyltransferase
MRVSRVLPALSRATETVERRALDARLVILFVLGAAVLREFLEQAFFERAIYPFPFWHHLAFYSFVFIAGTLIVSGIAGLDIAKVSKVSALGFSLVIFPPLVDRFLFLQSSPYVYALPQELGKNLLTFFLSGREAGFGVLLEIIAILLLASTYVFLKTLSLVRSVLTALSLYIMISLAVTPRLFLFFLPPSSDPDFQRWHHLIFFAFYFLLSLAAGGLFILRFNRTLPRAIWQEAWSFRTFHFVVMAAAGIFWRGALKPEIFPDLWLILCCFVLMIFLWLSTVLLNNYHDLSIDVISHPRRPLVTGMASSQEYRVLSFASGLLAFVLAFLLGAVPVLLTLLALLGSWAYSAPPLRLRKRLFSTFIIGGGSAIAFFIGYFGRTRVKGLSLDSRTLSLAIVMFAALSLGPLVKDLKDYKGDLQAGVRTFFTVYGIPKGMKIISSLLGVSLITPILLFHELRDIAFFGCIAGLSGWLFYKRGQWAFSLLGYGSALLYGFLRVTRII